MREHRRRDYRPQALESMAAHAGEADLPRVTRPVSMPIYQTSVFAVPDLDTVDAIYEGRERADIYSRFSNPSSGALEEAYAALEGAEAAVAAASGMAAIFAMLAAALHPGDHLVCDHEMYGGTPALLDRYFGPWGVSTTYVNTQDLSAVAAAVRPETRMVFTEMISNPTVRVADLPALAALCRRRGLLLAVDNTFATPYLARPLELGADLVVISATKFLGGHSDLIGGLVAGRADMMHAVRHASDTTGGTLDPFAAWLCLRGIKTLHLRLERQSANAKGLAEFLNAQPGVTQVHYPTLPSHPSRELAARLLPRGAGGVLSFTLAGGRAAADALIRALRMVSFVPSLGDVTTTLSHPASTSQRPLTPEQRGALGITDGMIRVSVGTEALDEIIADFRQALAAVTQA